MTSPNNTPTPLPACCIPSTDASVAERLYCAYNAAGPDGLRGLNHLGLPCPVWSELPEQIQHRWQAVAWRATTEVGTLTEVSARLARAARDCPEPGDQKHLPGGTRRTVVKVWFERFRRRCRIIRSENRLGVRSDDSHETWSEADPGTRWVAHQARLLPRPPDPTPEVDQLLSEFIDVLHAPEDLEPEDAERMSARIAELRASIVALVKRHGPSHG